MKLRYLGYPNCAEISPGGDILCTMKVEAAMDMVSITKKYVAPKETQPNKDTRIGKRFLWTLSFL